VVAGAGPAGLVCARELARRGLVVRIVGGMALGGELLNLGTVHGVPGDDAPAGADLAGRLTQETLGAGVHLDVSEVRALAAAAHGWTVHTDEGESVQARAVVVATGAAPRPLPVPGADRLTGRGVCYCAMCDGPLFAGRDVAVVGGDRWAFTEASLLAGVAAGVTLLHPGDRPGEDVLAPLARRPNVRMALRAAPLSVDGDEAVASVRYADDHGEHELAVAAVFGVTGRRPNTAFLDGVVALDADGRLPADDALACSASGLFAAGSVRAGAEDTVAAALADGQRAAASVAGTCMAAS